MKKKIYDIILIQEYAYNINDPIIAYEKVENVLIIRIDSIDKVERFVNKEGECKQSIYSEGKSTLIKSYKGNIKEFPNFIVNTGELKFDEFSKCETESQREYNRETFKKYIDQDYYFRYVPSEIFINHLEEGKMYLVFAYDNRHFERSTIFEVKEENGKFLVLDYKTNKFQPIETYLPHNE